MKPIRAAAAVAALSLILGASPSLARGGGHGGGHHHGGHHGGHHHGHHHGGGRHHGHHAGFHHGGHPHFGGPRGGGIAFGRPHRVWRGGHWVVVGGGGYPVYGGGYGYGPRPVVIGGGGCRSSRFVSLLPSGWHKVVTTKTCIVP